MEKCKSLELLVKSDNFEYYPESTIKFARDNLKQAQQIEHQLMVGVLTNNFEAYPDVKHEKVAYIKWIVERHFLLEVTQFGVKENKLLPVLQVNIRKGVDPRIPKLLPTEWVHCQQKLIIPTSHL